MATEFAAEYRDLLAQLKRNDKRDINCLSMLAEDNKQYAATIVDAIEQHILVVPAPVKLPALYVLDSIVKNVREPYTSLFAKSLPEVFGSVWDSTLPEKRASLGRLFGTWSGVFPLDVLERVKTRMAAAASAPAPAPPLLAAQPAAALPAAAVAPSYPAATVVLPPGAYGVAAVPGGGGPQPVVTLSAPQQGYAPAAGGLQYYAPQQLQQPYGLAPAVVMHGVPPLSPPHASWQQQQQQQQQQMPVDPRLRQHSPSPGLAAFGQQHQQPQPGALPPQLSDLLSSLAQTGVLKAPGAAPARRAWEDDPSLRSLELAPAFVKEVHEGVIATLAEASDKTRGAFLDLAFLRKQRQRGGGASSRSWYVTIDHWLTGTVAATEAAEAFGGEEDAAAAEAPPALEPEDPTQPCCAISGEPFDKVFDQEKEGWFYRDARRLNGDEAAAHGVADGAIVKVSALAEASHGPGAPGSAGGAAGGELDTAGLAADLAAAAAGAGAGGGGSGGDAAAAAMQVGGGAAAAAAAGAAAAWGEDEKKESKGAAGVKREAGAEEAPSPDVKRQRAQ